MPHKFGVLNYYTNNPLRSLNIGDFVQSLAAKQFLPAADIYIDREQLSLYKSEPVKMIMNGWYMTDTTCWPPSELIDPLFIAFHISPRAADKMLNKEGVTYLKKHAPIGCRDHNTVKLLKNKGIEAYHSNCLTLTLGNTYKREAITDEVLFVDVLPDLLPYDFLLFGGVRQYVKDTIKNKGQNLIFRNSILKKIFSKSILDKSVAISTYVRYSPTTDYYSLADEYLLRLSRAKYVVTSRIHCALPCLAMGTPVVFVNGGLIHSDNKKRLDGIVNLFPTVLVGKNGIDFNFEIDGLISENNFPVNTSDIESIKFALNQKCREFIKK